MPGGVGNLVARFLFIIIATKPIRFILRNADSNIHKQKKFSVMTRNSSLKDNIFLMVSSVIFDRYQLEMAVVPSHDNLWSIDFEAIVPSSILATLSFFSEIYPGFSYWVQYDGILRVYIQYFDYFPNVQ